MSFSLALLMVKLKTFANILPRILQIALQNRLAWSMWVLRRQIIDVLTNLSQTLITINSWHIKIIALILLIAAKIQFHLIKTLWTQNFSNARQFSRVENTKKAMT